MSKIIYCHLHYKFFVKVKAGTKTVEVRLFDEKRRSFEVGDKIIFINRSDEADTVTTEITNLKIFKSFEELFNAYDKISLGYDENEQASPEDMNNFYTKEDIEKYGVVAIEIKL